MSDRVVLVTGASSGIGEATATRLAAAGFTVYGAARRAERIAQLPGVIPIEMDITDDAQVGAAVKRIIDEQGRIDALQVDLYDQQAACPVLDTEDFYRDCRNMLTLDGCMTVNLFGQACNTDDSIQKITAVFGSGAVWSFKPTTAGNTIVLAWRQPRVFDKSHLQSQAQTIEARWPLPATKWLKALAPVA